MMSSKIYFLLALLFVFIICSTSGEQKSRKSNDASDTKKKVVAESNNDDYDKDKAKAKDEDEDDTGDDIYSALASYPANRYSINDSPENNYRTRTRGQGSYQSESPSSLYDDYTNGHDRSRSDYSNGNDRSRFDFANSFLGALPSMSYDSNTMFNSGPSCHSLVDLQHPIFADICGAVPQARYSLPNSFGHRERWQVAQLLMTLFGSSTDASCTRSLRLLLCPVLFPPCPNRHEPPAVLPCQSYCRAVKSRCALPTLDFLPCEVLPYSSDICPTNQPFGSFMPSGAFPAAPSPLAMADGFQSSRSFPSLQSLLSSPNLQAALASFPHASPSMQSATPFNPYSNAPQATDSLRPMYPDPSSRSYASNYQQPSRYTPSTRSATETRSPGSSSVVKA